MPKARGTKNGLHLYSTFLDKALYTISQHLSIHTLVEAPSAYQDQQLFNLTVINILDVFDFHI